MKKLIFVTKIVDKKFKCGLYMTDDDDRSRKKGILKTEENLQENTHVDIFWPRCSPVNLLHIFKTLFYRNTYGGLLLCCTPAQSAVQT